MNMKTRLLILLGMALVQGAMAQDFVREIDRKTGKVLLRGKIHFSDIQKESTCSWFNQGADAYQPKPAVIEALKKIAEPYHFVVFAGTWCGDTKDLLPRFYKVLREAGIDQHTVELYGVNRHKEALNIEHSLYNLTNIPTIIIMHQAHEVGRIIESVDSSIEESLLQIMEKDYLDIERRRAERLR